MPFPDLSSFVQQQFSAFSGYDEYDAQLSIWAYARRDRREESATYYQRHKATIKAKRTPEANRAHQAAWRARNPELARQRTREATRRWREAKKQKAA